MGRSRPAILLAAALLVAAAGCDEAGGQRSLWLDRLEFVDGRPRVDGPTNGPQEAP